MQYLLDTKDVNVEAVDASSWTALHIAGMSGEACPLHETELIHQLVLVRKRWSDCLLGLVQT